MFDWLWSSNATFRPLKEIPVEHRSYRIQQLSKATLGAGDLRKSVKLPEGENLFDWLASGVVDFYSAVNSLFSLISDKCTNLTCSETKAGPKYTFYWADEENTKKAISLPAKEYIGNVLDWVYKLMNDENLFPSNPDVKFPKNFEEICSKIFRRLFRIYSHIYFHHFEDLKIAGGESHFNTSLKHFIYFTHEFNLIPQNQLEPLKQIIEQILNY